MVDENRLVIGNQLGEQGYDEQHQEDPQRPDATPVGLEVVDAPTGERADPEPEELVGVTAWRASPHPLTALAPSPAGRGTG